DCESWMGKWASESLHYKEALDWYAKSASHGNARAMYEIAELYYKAGDYETAREWYEKELEAGDELEEASDRLKEIPATGSYAELFNYALWSNRIQNDLQSPSFPAAFAYALKGDIFSSAPKEDILVALWIYIPAELIQDYLESGNVDQIEMELAERTFNDISSIASDSNADDDFVLRKNLYDCYRQYAQKGNPAASYLMDKIKDEGIDLP
ncbi:MAG: hypothetical protein II837_08220, partial [Treponema sp.]|nr:hypothetical protein [Treponema sp.]